ncbi:MAG: phage/plasmid replication protein [Muribaculaceae bacterium]
MKIITSIDYISDINHKSFVAVTKFNEVLYYKYQQESPYSLLIMIDYAHNELVIEFTGKVLLDDYPKLINKETIIQCFYNINKLNICNLDVNSIMQDSEVVKCDVTKDIKSSISSIASTIRQNLTNYTKWNVKGYNSGIVIENTVSTPKYKKRLAVYDKGKELNKATNINFINSLSNKDGLLNYFNDKIRFELNINTKSQIRQLLNIPNNRLMSVLESTTNPILTIIDEAVKYEPQQHKAQTLRDYEHELLLRDCDFDLVKVEAKVRALSSKNTSIKRLMQPYKELYKQINSVNSCTIDIRELVA